MGTGTARNTTVRWVFTHGGTAASDPQSPCRARGISRVMFGPSWEAGTDLNDGGMDPSACSHAISVNESRHVSATSNRFGVVPDHQHAGRRPRRRPHRQNRWRFGLAASRTGLFDLTNGRHPQHTPTCAGCITFATAASDMPGDSRSTAAAEQPVFPGLGMPPRPCSQYASVAVA